MCALKAKNWDLPEIPAKMRKRKGKDKDDIVAQMMGDQEHLLYRDLQGYREDAWRKHVLAFEANPDSVYNAYWYVATHPMFYSFKPWSGRKKEQVPAIHERHLVHEQGWDYVRITPHLVNPANNKISDDPSLNTKVEFWYEFGPTLFRENRGQGVSGMDHKCMGGAKTYDRAIIKVAKAIHKAYGNDRKQVMKKWKDPELPTEA
jgi:hypothetical protein